MSDTELDLLDKADSALAEKQLITLDPAAYTAAVYKPFQDRLALLKVEAPAVVYDVTTTAGMELAKEWRAKCKAVRLDADKERESRKAPIIKIGKLLQSTYNEIETAVEALEGRFDADIKRQEAIKETERLARIAAEEARTTAIHARIQVIRDTVTKAGGIHSDKVADLSQALNETEIGPDFEEFQQQAKDAKDAALLALHKIYDDRLAQEQEAARIKAEREELATLRRQQAAQEAADRARLAQEEADAKVRRGAEEAQARAQRAAEDAQAAEARKAEQDRLDAERAELTRLAAAQQADFDRQAQELAAQRAAAAPQPCPQEPPAPAPALARRSASERPTADEIVTVLAEHYGRDRSEVIGWLMDLAF